MQETETGIITEAGRMMQEMVRGYIPGEMVAPYRVDGAIIF